MLEFCRDVNTDKMNEIFDRLITVNANTDKPTKEDVLLYCDKDKEIEDWYSLMDFMQGNLNHYVEFCEFKHMIDSQNFIYNSPICEYAYIINLDENILEVWCGFQQIPDYTNRYGAEPNNDACENEYYPCTKCLDIPLDNIYGRSDDILDHWVGEMVEACDEAYKLGQIDGYADEREYDNLEEETDDEYLI